MWKWSLLALGLGLLFAVLAWSGLRRRSSWRDGEKLWGQVAGVSVTPAGTAPIPWTGTAPPQGDFAAFLKSKPNEKAQTLEQITGTQIYSLLSTKVYDLAEEQKKLFEDKQREVELSPVLDDAVVLTKQEQLKGITEEAKVLETQISKIEKESRWISETAELRNQFLRVKAEL